MATRSKRYKPNVNKEDILVNFDNSLIIKKLDRVSTYLIHRDNFKYYRKHKFTIDLIKSGNRIIKKKPFHGQNVKFNTFLKINKIADYYGEYFADDEINEIIEKNPHVIDVIRDFTNHIKGIILDINGVIDFINYTIYKYISGFSHDISRFIHSYDDYKLGNGLITNIETNIYFDHIEFIKWALDTKYIIKHDISFERIVELINVCLLKYFLKLYKEYENKLVYIPFSEDEAYEVLGDNSYRNLPIIYNDINNFKYPYCSQYSIVAYLHNLPIEVKRFLDDYRELRYKTSFYSLSSDRRLELTEEFIMRYLLKKDKDGKLYNFLEISGLLHTQLNKILDSYTLGEGTLKLFYLRYLLITGDIWKVISNDHDSMFDVKNIDNDIKNDIKNQTIKDFENI